MLVNPVEKDRSAVTMEEMRTLFSKSLVASRDLNSGHVVEREDITARKPGSGIPAAKINDYIGRTLSRDVAADSFFSPDDFEE
jgi:N,N'-diacetyllegionaminate synthase